MSYFTYGQYFPFWSHSKELRKMCLVSTSWERAWLAEGNSSTHVIWGQLRIFSFLSDAGQFGANQAYSAVMATIIALLERNWRKKLFFVIVAALGILWAVTFGYTRSDHHSVCRICCLFPSSQELENNYFRDSF